MALALLWLASACATAAQDRPYIRVEPSDMSAAGKTYGALVGMALPGTVQTSGRMVVETDLTVPHIEGADFTITAPAPVAVDAIEALPLSVEGREHLALVIRMAEAGDGLGPVAALALFDISGAPALVDVKDVGFDRMSGFAQPPSLAVGLGHELILVHNSHGNAGQYYDATTIVDVVEGELSLVDMVLMLSDQGCAGGRAQHAYYRAAAPAEAGRGDWQASVVERIEPPVEACPGIEPYIPGETAYVVDYRWNAAAGRYEAEGDGWAALDDVNSERY